MIDWNKYIKWGKFTSTHGVELPFKFEFSRLENEERDKEIILTCVLSASVLYDLVVIDTVHPKELEKYAKMIFYPTTGVFDGKRLHKLKRKLLKYVIYDDVVTTGKSMLRCIDRLNHLPDFCICLIDRRKEALKSVSDRGWSLKLITVEEIVKPKV